MLLLDKLKRREGLRFKDIKMACKIQDGEFSWVSVVGTWKYEMNRKYMFICSVSTWAKKKKNSHSL